MRPGISITLSPSDRRRLAAIVLLSADDIGTVEIMRRTQKSSNHPVSTAATADRRP